MNFSCLSEAEVKEKYRRADDKYEMLKILAELTCSTKTEMMEFLGVEEKPVSKMGRRPAVSVDQAMARRYYEAGMSDSAIAAAIGVSKSAVARWRYRNELSPNPTETVISTANRLKMYEMLYREGHSDSYIAKLMGVSDSNVGGWRKRHNLPSNFKRGQYDRRKAKDNG